MHRNVKKHYEMARKRIHKHPQKSMTLNELDQIIDASNGSILDIAYIAFCFGYIVGIKERKEEA